MEFETHGLLGAERKPIGSLPSGTLFWTLAQESRPLQLINQNWKCLSVVFAVDDLKMLVCVKVFMEASDGTWRCIDAEVLQAAGSLGVGEFMAVETFSLLESMSALELMDIKMDPPERAAKPIDLQELVDAGQLPLESLSLASARALALGLLVREVAWCNGTSLAETVFTCLYLHDPALKHLVASVNAGGAHEKHVARTGTEGLGMRAWSGLAVGTLKTVALTREAVFHADIYEEEDFHSSVYSFNLTNVRVFLKENVRVPAHSFPCS